MRKPIYKVLLLWLLLLLATPAVRAASLDFFPASQSVETGNPVAVALSISGLGNGAAPSLSTFDVDITFDPTVLSWSNATFGDPVLGDQLDVLGLGGNSITATITNPGTLKLFELSLDAPSDLDTLQAGNFTLVTLMFETLAQGSSTLGMNVNVLGDANGEPLTATLSTGSITVVPLPSALLLFASGMASLYGFGWRRRKSIT